MIHKVVSKTYKKISRSLIEYDIKKRYKINSDIKIYGRVKIENPNISFGKNVSIYDGVQIWGDGHINIGDNVAIGKDTIIFARLPLNIGGNTSIAAQCYIIDSDHGIKKTELIQKQSLESSAISIGEDVWIAAGCKILKGAQISQGSVIGAMSLVNGMTEKFSINVGIPSRKVGERM